MKKATYKTYLILLLVFLLSISLALTAFACSKTNKKADEPEEEPSDFSSLVSNGDFSTFSSDTAQPYTPSNWTNYTTSETSTDDKIAGIIDTGADYDSNRSLWGDLANPYGAVTANKVLMIYNKTENVYGFKNTFQASSCAYYSISVKVKVVNVDADKGASIQVSTDNDYVIFDNINATNEFTTYTIYMQAPSAESSTVTVRISLGYDDHKVQGYAFFDDVVATKINKKEYTDATESSTVKKISMLYPNSEFNYFAYSSSATLKTPTGWTWSNGANVSGTSVNTSDRFNGIVSTEESVWETLAETSYGANPGLPEENSEDKYIMAIIKNKTSGDYSPTAGYYSSSSIRIDRETLYEISIWVKATVDESDSDKGARVVLKGTDTYESEVINTTGNTLNGGWAKVIFYVLGNQLRSQELTIQLWIGNDKANNTLTQGKIFFDKLNIKTIDTTVPELNLTTREAIADHYGALHNDEADYQSYVKFIDLKTEDGKLIDNNNFTDLDENGLPSSLDIAPIENVVEKDGDVIKKLITLADFEDETTNWKEKYGIDENPLYPYTYSNVLIVNNIIPCAYAVKSKDLTDTGYEDFFEIKQSLSYRISVWIKTVGLEEGKTVTLKLVDKEDQEINSFSVNTQSYENDDTNNYVEYSFYLTGEMPTASDGTPKTNYVRLVISNGSGTQYTPSSFQKGAFLIANINMEQITYTEYEAHNDTSGTYSKAKDYAENSATITNGNFNSYDRKNTTFGDDGYVAMKDKDDNENLVGAISSWTNNVDKKYGTTKTAGETLVPDEPYKITKVESGDNDNKDFTASISGKTITTISIVGDFDKTYDKSTDWEKVFDINKETGKVTWNSDYKIASGNYTIKIKVGEDWLDQTYTLSKVENGENPYKEFTAEGIINKEISAIRITSHIDKTYNSDSEWNKVFNVNTITGKIGWNSSNNLPACQYTVTIVVDQKEHNDLIAGIINYNASEEYLEQFGLTAGDIYKDNDWAEGASADTAVKSSKFGAPNLLMITTRKGVAYINLKNTYVDGAATNDMTTTPAIKSPSVSLSSNSYYLFKCYGKALNGAIGEVYVTTTSSDTKVTSFLVEDKDGWCEYTFYVETGLASSISAQFEIYYGRKGSAFGDENYSGTLLFDSFSYVTLTEKEFADSPAGQRSIFSTITFDNASASETAVAPSGFSAENSSSSNSDTQVSGIIAKNNYAYTKSTGEHNLGIYKSVEKQKEDGTTVTEDVLDETSFLDANYIFSNAGMQGDATVGEYLLLINNRKSTYQTYYLSNLSLASESYYQFSVYVRTAKLAKDEFAKVFVSISDEPLSFEVNTTEYDDDGNEISNDWKKLTFYLKNEKSSAVPANLNFQLGENSDDGKMKGFLFIDNISLTKITEDEYNEATKDYEVYEKDENDEYKLDENNNKILTEQSKTFNLTNKVTVLKADEETDNGETDTEETTRKKTSLNTTLLWTYITSIAIAVVLIAVIVVWLIKKYHRPKKSSSDQKKADYDRTTKKSDKDDAAKPTGSARDEYKD